MDKALRGNICKAKAYLTLNDINFRDPQSLGDILSMTGEMKSDLDLPYETDDVQRVAAQMALKIRFTELGIKAPRKIKNDAIENILNNKTPEEITEMTDVELEDYLYAVLFKNDGFLELPRNSLKKINEGKLFHAKKDESESLLEIERLLKQIKSKRRVLDEARRKKAEAGAVLKEQGELAASLGSILIKYPKLGTERIRSILEK